MKQVLSSAILLCAFVCMVQDIVAQDMRIDSVTVGSALRIAQTFLPKNYSPSTKHSPLIVEFHGANQTPDSYASIAQFHNPEYQQEFIVVYPKGTGAIVGSFGQTWNAGNCCPNATSLGTNDVAFFNALLDALIARYSIDSTRVYVTGFSNGGMMAHRLACESSTRIAAIAAMSGGLELNSPCAPRTTPMPVLHIHSVNDAVVPYNGGGALNLHPIEPAIATWVSLNGLQTVQVDTILSTSLGVGRRWANNSTRNEVLLYKCLDGGHSWAGNSNGSQALQATPTALAFFARHTRNTQTSSTESLPQPALSLYPNPSAGTITIQRQCATPTTILFINSLGASISTIATSESNCTIDIHSFSAGMYSACIDGVVLPFVVQ